MTGVRAYERRADLRANNQRLIDYARAGGTVIVNYNKFEFNEAQYGPYPGKVGRERVTDENSVVRVLQPQHPVFTTPNRIADADWKGWRQERGLYFFDTAGRDPQIRRPARAGDPFPYNKGPKRGALVEAKVGQGRWIYVGLGLWRQLPAGTDGAYRLMANLISLGSAHHADVDGASARKVTPAPRPPVQSATRRAGPRLECRGDDGRRLGGSAIGGRAASVRRWAPSPSGTSAMLQHVLRRMGFGASQADLELYGGCRSSA